MQQVFAQACELWMSGEDWSLSDEDEQTRVEESAGFTQILPAIELISGHWADYRTDYSGYAIMNRSEIVRHVTHSNHLGDMSAVLSWITKNLGKPRRLKRKYRCWAFPVGPFPSNCQKLSPDEAKEYSEWARQNCDSWLKGVS